MTRKIRWIVVLLFITLAGCRTENDIVAPSIVTPASTVLPSATALHLPAAQASTPTISPDVMQYQCLEIGTDLPANSSQKGVIVYNSDANLFSWLSNQETNETYSLAKEADETLWQFEVSPDRQYLKYVNSSGQTQTDRLVIAGANGQSILSQVTSSADWDWFDNEHLVISESSAGGTHRLLLLDPFNGEQKHLPADFPNSEVFSPDRYPLWYQASRGLPLYDLTLTRAIYPAIDEKEKQPTIVLWNTETNQRVTEIVTQDDWGNTPIWMSDGRGFVIAINLNSPDRASTLKEFFAVSRDGEVKQLTRFGNSFSKVNILDSYSLSPTEKLVAFWIVAQPSPYDSSQLAVLNLDTGKVTNYCIKGDAFADNASAPSPPIWSPDGTQLLVISRIPEDTKVRRVVVIDIAKNYAAEINRDMEPVGWMIAP